MRCRESDSHLAGMRQRQQGRQRARLAGQAGQVHLMRGYRRGEVPDIVQLSLADFVGPLSATHPLPSSSALDTL